MNTTTKRALVLAALAAAGLTACGTKPAADAAITTTTEAPPVTDETTDEDIEIMSLDLSFDADAVCPPFTKLLDAGMDRDVLIGFGVEKFEEGYGSTLTPAGRAHLISLIEACWNHP